MYTTVTVKGYVDDVERVLRDEGERIREAVAISPTVLDGIVATDDDHPSTITVQWESSNNAYPDEIVKIRVKTTYK